MRVELQPAFVLHARAYRDTSLIVDLLTLEHGRVGVVARGARSRKGGMRQKLSPFQPLLVNFQGRGELKTLTAAELAAVPVFLTGKNLYSALYINELLMRLLMPMEPQAAVYAHYQLAIAELCGEGDDVEPSLRRFEFKLLEQLGYGLDFSADAGSGAVLEPAGHYRYVNETGFLASADMPGHFSGAVLRALNESDFSDPAVRRAAKHLSRAAFKPLLGSKPLKSRELFRAP